MVCCFLLGGRIDGFLTNRMKTCKNRDVLFPRRPTATRGNNAGVYREHLGITNREGVEIASPNNLFLIPLQNISKITYTKKP